MYARLLAFACLLSSSVLFGGSVASSTQKSTVGVYLKTDGVSSGLSLTYMRDELAQLLTPAGIQIEWLQPGAANSVDRVLSVELRGSCQPGNSSEKFKNHSALASTAVQDGKILPFSWVDCGSLDRFLGNALKSRPESQRTELYGRAIARLMAHEFFHVIAETEGHTSTGVSKTAFTVADLLTDHIAFQPDALAMLHSEMPETVLAVALPAESDASVFDAAAELIYDDALVAR